MSGHISSLTRPSTSPGETIALRRRAQHAPRRGHHHRGRHALVGDVADHDADLAVRQLDEVVEVAADLARGPVVGGDCQPGRSGSASAGSSAGSASRRAAPARSARATAPPPPAGARAGRPAAPARPGRRASRAACGRRSSTSWSERRGPRLSRPISSPWLTSGTTSFTPAARSASSAGESSSSSVELDRAGRALEVGDDRIVRRDLDRARVGRSCCGDTASTASVRRRRGALRRRITLVIDCGQALIPLLFYGATVPKSLRRNAMPCAPLRLRSDS